MSRTVIDYRAILDPEKNVFIEMEKLKTYIYEQKKAISRGQIFVPMYIPLEKWEEFRFYCFQNNINI